MIKVVIFDVDGTLVDSVDLHAQAWKRAFQDFGYDVPYDKIRPQIGKGSDQLIPVLLSQADYDRQGEEIAQRRKEFYQQELMPQARPFDQVRPLFERIKADGKSIVLASSARTKTLEHYQELLNIKDLIDGVTSTDDAERSKPHPDIFQAALGKIEGVSVEEAIAIGDSPHDAEAASRMNLKIIGVLCGGFPEEVLRQAGCIAIYQDPADLLANYDRSLLSSNQPIAQVS